MGNWFRTASLSAYVMYRSSPGSVLSSCPITVTICLGTVLKLNDLSLCDPPVVKVPTPTCCCFRPDARRSRNCAVGLGWRLVAVSLLDQHYQGMENVTDGLKWGNTLLNAYHLCLLVSALTSFCLADVSRKMAFHLSASRLPSSEEMARSW